MRALARAFTSVVWMAALASSGFHAAGCSTAPRPDAEVARSVEAAERRRLAAIVLASADDELPVALPVAGRVEADAGPGAAPQPAAVVPSHATADRYFSPERSEAGQRAFTFSPDSERSVAGDPVTVPPVKPASGDHTRPEESVNDEDPPVSTRSVVVPGAGVSVAARLTEARRVAGAAGPTTLASTWRAPPWL